MTGFREALDLGHIVTRYEALNKAGAVFLTGEVRREEVLEPIPARLYERTTGLGSSDHPDLVGTGPARASTSRVMAEGRPVLSHDVNGYYRALGIPFPYVNATRKDIRMALHGIPGALDDRRLIYYAKQLLSPMIRAEYDAMPLGKQYLNDDYVQDAFKAQVAEAARQRTLKGDYVTAEEVLDEMGYILKPDDAPEETVDEDRLKRQDEPTVGAAWQYAFYVWKTTSWDVDRLAEWQAALIPEVSDFAPHLVVGAMGKMPHRFLVATANNDLVIFLNRTEPVTTELVAAASAALRTHHESTRSTSGVNHTATSSRRTR